jgi:serine/threonine-protein kinase
LLQLGRAEEARLTWAKTLESSRAGVALWTGYPELCLFAGNKQEYRRARTTMLQRFGSPNEPVASQQLARACLLLPIAPGDEEDLALATALADRAMAQAKSTVPAWRYSYYQFTKGLADYRNGHLDESIKRMGGDTSKVLGPCPKFVVAMALHDQGKDAEARRALADAVPKFDWRPARADSTDLWIYHILRREAQAKVLPDFPALVDGAAQPRDNDERLPVIGECQYRGLHARCARLFADACASDPNLTRDDRLNPGFVAACSASALLAPRERATGGTDIDASNRAQLQELACVWLSERLDAEVRRMPARDAQFRGWLQRDLISWRNDPSLAGIRNLTELQSLTPELRAKCVALWNAVDNAIARLQDGGTAGKPTTRSGPN